MLASKFIPFAMAACALASCAGNLSSSEGGGTEAASQSPATPSKSEALLNGMSKKLSASSTGLDPSQIATIIGAAQSALSNANLYNSSDMGLITPTAIQGALAGMGGLNLGGANSQAGLLSALGNSGLSSLVGASGGSPSTSQIESLASSLFGGLGTAGVKSGDLPGVSGSVMSSLLGNLSSSGLPSGSLSSVVQSLASGAVQGLGGSGMTSGELAPILQGLGGGSFTGLSSLTGLLGGGGGTSNETLSTLLSSFTTGSNLGLGNLLGGSGGLTSTGNTALISSLLAGLESSAKSSPSGMSLVQGLRAKY